MSDVPATALAQPDAPLTTPPPDAVAASTAAIDQGDMSTYREARRAERAGKPLAAVPAPMPGETPSPAQEPRQLSRRQQEINERIRQSVEAATREKDAEIARLRAATAPTPPPLPPTPPAAPAPVERFPDYATYLQQHPEATLEAWLDARDAYRDDLRTRQANERLAAEHANRWHEARVSKFTAQTTAAKAADPGFATKLSPDVRNLEPAAIAIAAGRPLTIDNAIAEEILDSPVAPALMLHLSASPADLQQLRACRTPRELARRVGALERGLAAAEPASASFSPASVPVVPEPPVVLGTRATAPVDPTRRSMDRGDFSSYRAARRAERAARMSH